MKYFLYQKKIFNHQQQKLVVTMAMKTLLGRVVSWRMFTVEQHLANFHDDLQHRSLVGKVKLCMFVYLFLKHATLAFWPGSHRLARMIFIDFYYFTFGEPYFRSIELLSIIPVGAGVYFVYNIFEQNAPKFVDYTERLLRRYARGETRSLTSGRLMFAQVATVSISVVREFQILYALIVICGQWNVLVAATTTTNPWQLIFGLLVLATSLAVHVLCVRTFLNMYAAVLVEILLYDQLIVNSLKQMNRSLKATNFYRQQSYRVVVKMFIFIDTHSCLFGRIFSIYLYLMLPNFAMMFFEVGRFELMRKLLPVVICVMSFGGPLVVIYIFGIYVTLFHQSYRRLSIDAAQDQQLRLVARWRALKMIELLGGPEVGLRYYLINTVITKHSLLSVSVCS